MEKEIRWAVWNNGEIFRDTLNYVARCEPNSHKAAARCHGVR